MYVQTVKTEQLMKITSDIASSNQLTAHALALGNGMLQTLIGVS